MQFSDTQTTRRKSVPTLQEQVSQTAGSTSKSTPKNLAVFLKEVKKFQIEAVPYPPKPPPGYVTVRIVVVGVCGADVNYYSLGYCGPYRVSGPLILGHECAGRIVDVGDGVTLLQIGDRVAVEPGVPCRYCDICKCGRYNLCPQMSFMATPPVNGALVHYISYPADFCFKLPEHMTYEEGLLLEPLALSIHGCSRAGLGVSSRVLITGAGPIGLCTTLIARASGATKIVVVDRLQNRLDVAKSIGADVTFLADTPDLLEKLREYNITHSIECSGANQLGTALQVTSRAGKVVMLGRPASSDLELPLQEAVDNEVDLLGAFRYHGHYPGALSLVESGRVNLNSLITHRFPMEETQQAFEMAQKCADGALKVVIYLEDLPRDQLQQRCIPPPSKSNSEVTSPSRFSSGFHRQDSHVF